MIISYQCKRCGKPCKAEIKYSWEIEHDIAKLCDSCLVASQPYFCEVDTLDARLKFEETAKELHEQQEADLKCQNM